MKRPKLFYTPGMISLLIVPVLFYMYLPVEKKQHALKFFLLKDDYVSPDDIYVADNNTRLFKKKSGDINIPAFTIT